jgi:adenylylsulfate reductase subunit A
MQDNQYELDKWEPYGKVKPRPANIRNWLMMMDVEAGKSPIYMQTAEAIQRIADTAPDEKSAKKKLKELEAEAWEDFLDMTISQAILWAATNVEPEKKPSEIMACDPYFIGSHSGGNGAWVSGPEDLQTDETKDEYFWGYANMTTVPGLFACGDASGASSHKFSSGSFTEGRIAGKAAIAYILDNNEMPNIDEAQIETLREMILKPIDMFAEHKDATTDPEVNPNYIRPKQFMYRLQKIMDEYAGGVSSQFKTNDKLLERGLELLAMLKEDQLNLAANGLHELTRAWEATHRMCQAEAHVRSVLFREETRWPGYYFRSDTPEMKEDWRVFVNATYKDGEWVMSKRPIHEMF